eukprot:TRINITY_DN5578_c0_g3_i1.p2 TRINITY_DN5578_c0_g3~~TRINITY_DN5578_c0_g3_i1.p2  ORF type:complete len:205 (+),score=-23.77 TRINITY_DN5578_c0_g3_i1:309-923(+)
MGYVRDMYVCTCVSAVCKFSDMLTAKPYQQRTCTQCTLFLQHKKQTLKVIKFVHRKVRSYSLQHSDSIVPQCTLYINMNSLLINTMIYFFVVQLVFYFKRCFIVINYLFLCFNHRGQDTSSNPKLPFYQHFFILILKASLSLFSFSQVRHYNNQKNKNSYHYQKQSSFHHKNHSLKVLMLCFYQDRSNGNTKFYHIIPCGVMIP